MEKKIDIEKISADLLKDNNFSTYTAVEIVELANKCGLDVVLLEKIDIDGILYANDRRLVTKGKYRHDKVIALNMDDKWEDAVSNDAVIKKRIFIVACSVANYMLHNDGKHIVGHGFKENYEKNLDDDVYNLAIAILLPKDAMEIRIKDNYERTHYNLRAFIYSLAKEFKVEQHHVMNRLINLGYLRLSTGGDVSIDISGTYDEI